MEKLLPDLTQDHLTVVLGDHDYRVIRPWGKLPRGVAFNHISQLALDRHDRVYVFQRGNPPVLVFEPSGAFAGSWGEGAFCDAHGITVTADDRVLLVDRDAHQV